MYLRPSTALTYAGARLALDAALARASGLGVAVNVAVLDLSGVPLALARMDGAFTNSAAIAVDKARTVIGFGGAPTDGLYQAIEGEPAVRDGIAGRSGVAAFAGGVAIVVDGGLIGAVGVSGGSAAQDKEVAQAGAAALTAAATTSREGEQHP